MKEKTNKGITLIALVITIIVLLILAGVSIAMLTGENGILTNTTKAKVENAHGAVREAMQLEYTNYKLEKKIGKGASTLVEYFQEKEIIGETEEDGKYVIDVEKLLGTKPTLGLGTDGKDVYKLEEVTEESDVGKLGEIASIKAVKVAATTSTDKTYKVMYYGKTTSEDRQITALIEETSSSNGPQKQFGEPFTFKIIVMSYDSNDEFQNERANECTALTNMTWEDWISSDYNTLEVWVSDDGYIFWRDGFIKTESGARKASW